MQNGFVESFNGRMRDEILNETMFRTMAHARALIRAWTDDCNEERPHSALGYQTPKAFAERLFTMGRQQRCARGKLRAAAGCSTCANRRIKPEGSDPKWMKVQ